MAFQYRPRRPYDARARELATERRRFSDIAGLA
jgi:hypothetical protein